MQVSNQEHHSTQALESRGLLRLTRKWWSWELVPDRLMICVGDCSCFVFTCFLLLTVAWPGLACASEVSSLWLSQCVCSLRLVHLVHYGFSSSSFSFLFSSSNSRGSDLIGPAHVSFPQPYHGLLGSPWIRPPSPTQLAIARGKVWSFAVKPGDLLPHLLSWGFLRAGVVVHTCKQTLYAK